MLSVKDTGIRSSQMSFTVNDQFSTLRALWYLASTQEQVMYVTPRIFDSTYSKKILCTYLRCVYGSRRYYLKKKYNSLLKKMKTTPVF